MSEAPQTPASMTMVRRAIGGRPMTELGMRYESPASQAWLRLWVTLYGPSSRLAPYLEDSNVDRPAPAIPRARALDDQAGKQTRRHSRPPPLEKAARPSAPPLKPRVARRIERDIDRVTRLPTSEWAKRITDDPLVSDITLQDIIDSIDDYFEVFDGMRKINKDAYAYFSRVGSPILTRHTAVWTRQLDAPVAIADPRNLPSYFGIFLARTHKEYRKEIIEDAPSLMDFHLFEKPRNFATVAAHGTTVFAHHMISLKRNSFSKEEMKKYPWTSYNWGVWWYVGVEPSGQVRALPCRMQHYQPLPNGDGVHHSGFMIPPALCEGQDGRRVDPHDHVRCVFNAAVAMTAASVGGIQVTIRKGKKAARFGVPITALKGFFADREPNGERRKPIIHFRHSHDRHMQDGRIIAVGEHLSGERFFTWRGYDITVGVSGIHFPSPEGFTAPLYIVNDPDAPLPPDAPSGADVVFSKHVGKLMKERIWKDHRVPIRRGKPTKRYVNHSLPHEKPTP